MTMIHLHIYYILKTHYIYLIYLTVSHKQILKPNEKIIMTFFVDKLRDTKHVSILTVHYNINPKILHCF